jgi:carbonic anhydrase/acetyltransferase-like protein (isoleucine patch superfamily)
LASFRASIYGLVRFGWLMLIEHGGKRPSIHDSAFVAPTAIVCGNVSIGPRTHIAFGAVIISHGCPVVIGTQSIVRKNALVRATAKQPVRIGDYVLVGPNAALYGCTIEDEVFLATGVTIFHEARIGERTEVRINGAVHVRSVLPECESALGKLSAPFENLTHVL